MAKLFIDTHVHIYPEYDVSGLLDASLGNFKKYSDGERDSKLALALTERFDSNFFKSNKENSKKFGKWELSYSPKTGLIHATNSNEEIFLLAGRQNISSEKLEILTLGSDDFRAEGLPAFEIIKGAQESGLVVILPWSFGKWTGKRLTTLRKLISDTSLDFCLGDPAHRFGFNPKVFKESPRIVLCGTDPLPLDGEENRVASYGSVFEFEENEVSSKTIVKTLMKGSKQFGTRVGLVEAVKLQLRLRV